MTSHTVTSREFVDVAADILDNVPALRFRVSGGSMTPWVRDGDILTIGKVDPGRLRIGDVVFCRRSGGTALAHRLVRRTTGGRAPFFVTRGDARWDEDEPFTAGQVLGRVSDVRRGARYWHLDFLQWRVLALVWVRLFPVPQYVAWLGHRVLRRAWRWFDRRRLAW